MFWFEEVAPFNARGLRRCKTPGIGIANAPGGPMNADLWRDREHQVLVRFTWAGWRYHYRAVRAGGGQVPDLMLDQLLECVAEVQGEWMAEAPDMPPEVPMKPEPNDDC